MTTVIERVDGLEQTVQDFVRSVGVEFRKLYNSQRQTEAELCPFKEEMSDFKDETRREQREMNKVRLKRRFPDERVKETLDFVCLNSTKATLRIADVDSLRADIAAFRTFFPEHNALPLVGILVSLVLEKSLIAYAERQGFLVLAAGDELMEVKNRPDFEPKRW